MIREAYATPEQLYAVKQRWAQLFGDGRIPGLEPYTGIGKTLGSTPAFCSRYNAMQFLALLSLSHDPGKVSMEKVDMEILRENQILKGIKVIDLGCGHIPSFARCARAFGAQAYTADIIGAHEFAYFDGFDDGMVAAERQNHVQVDLRRDSSIDQILKSAQGHFDVVTSSMLKDEASRYGKVIEAPHNVEKIAVSLLKPRGIYYQAEKDRVVVK